MKLKVTKAEARILRQALEGRLTTLKTLANHSKPSPWVQDQTEAAQALAQRLFNKEVV